MLQWYHVRLVPTFWGREILTVGNRFKKKSPISNWGVSCQPLGRVCPSLAGHVVTVVGDAARVELLRRYGGTYLDLDGLTLRPLPHSTNWLAQVTDHLVGNAALSFTPQHPLLQVRLNWLFFYQSAVVGPQTSLRKTVKVLPFPQSN